MSEEQEDKGRGKMKSYKRKKIEKTGSEWRHDSNHVKVHLMKTKDDQWTRLGKEMKRRK